MIKFFRKIRQRLLTENKFSNYLLYAVGEIVLVVFGILIALQINNWNERRKQHHVLTNIYKIIVEDLNDDTHEIKESLKIKKAWEPLIMKVLDGTMTAEDYKNCPECLYMIFGFNDLAIETRGYNLLSSFDNLSEITADSLSLKISRFYSKQLTELHADDQLKSNDLESNINEWKNNYEWASDYISGRNTTGFLEYALTNHDYVNRVASYYLLHYRVDIPNHEAFLKKATYMLHLIQERISEEMN